MLILYCLVLNQLKGLFKVDSLLILNIEDILFTKY